ncbi:MAG: hypothetical protein RBT49_15800 [Bacteroidales bacterium]|jgi:hypothetical protein|nr:hypothetical protein [Bacteroidales bacterium]
MKYFSYVVARDFGFAPNPFGQHCTLATCKPIIRRNSELGDWIFGITPKVKDKGNRLVFAMKVTQKMTFDEYWASPEFQYKKPVMNGSLKQLYGDNIYHKDKDTDAWIQEDSHHSKDNGETNYDNLKRDVSGQYVLISDYFYYFGELNVEIPFLLKTKFSIGIGQKQVKEEYALKLIEWLDSNYEKGLIGVPLLFTNFQRYDGVS